MPRTSARQAPPAAAIPGAQREAWSGGGPALRAPLALWLDLTLLNRTGLTQVLQRYTLPLEVTTYFHLRFQSPKVIAVNRALFLVTCVVVPSLRQLFVPHELKLCVTPTLVAGLYDRALCTQPRIGSTLAQNADLPPGGVAQFVWKMLDGVVASYETVARTVLNHVLTRQGTEELRVWKQRVAALAESLGQQRVFLHNAAHAGRKVGVDAHHEESAALDIRLERLLVSIDGTRNTASDTHPRPDSSDRAPRSTP
jgi:hypothetical protein